MSVKKVAITGASTYGVKNHGDDAMLATLVQGLKKAYPDLEITFLCRHPDPEFDAAFGFRSIKNLDHDSKQMAKGRIFWGMNQDDPDNHLRAIAEAVSSADLLIIGGNCFMELFPNGFLQGVSSYGATLATLAKFVGTPFALYGVNVVDEIKQQTTRAHARFMVNNARAATVREQHCLEYLAKTGASIDHVSVLSDPVFGMEKRSIDATNILARENIFLKDKPVIGFGFRFEYWSRDDAEYSAVAQKVARSLDALLKRLDAQVLFIPNCTYVQGDKWQDDRLAHRAIAEKMANKDAVYTVNSDLNVFETVALFDLLKMHVSNRRHSCIFAAISGVPFVALNTSLVSHMPPFLADLGLAGQIATLDDMQGLERMVEATWCNEGSIKAKMRERVEELRVSAQKHVPTLLGLVA